MRVLDPELRRVLKKATLLDVGGTQILFTLGGYEMEITFYSTSWQYQHRLEIHKGKELKSAYISSHRTTELLKLFGDPTQAQKTWVVFRLAADLSMRVCGIKLHQFLSDSVSWEISLLSGVYRSVSRINPGLVRIENLIKAVKEGIECGLFSEARAEGVWIRRIFKLPEKWAWKKITTGEGYK